MQGSIGESRPQPDGRHGAPTSPRHQRRFPRAAVMRVGPIPAPTAGERRPLIHPKEAEASARALVPNGNAIVARGRARRPSIRAQVRPVTLSWIMTHGSVPSSGSSTRSPLGSSPHRSKPGRRHVAAGVAGPYDCLQHDRLVMAVIKSASVNVTFHRGLSTRPITSRGVVLVLSPGPTRQIKRLSGNDHEDLANTAKVMDYDVRICTFAF